MQTEPHIVNLKSSAGKLEWTSDEPKGQNLHEYLKGNSPKPVIAAGAIKLFPMKTIDYTIALYKLKILVVEDHLGLGLGYKMCADYFSRLGIREIREIGGLAAILIATNKRNDLNKSYKQVILINVDTDPTGSKQNCLVAEFEDSGMPMTSFKCLSRFFKPSEGVSRIESGKCIVVDYTPDRKIPLTAGEKKVLRANKEKYLTSRELSFKKTPPTTFLKTIMPPEPGFTLMHGGFRNWSDFGNDWGWHRAGAILLQDQERDMCILLGQDEGTYFGTELPSMVNTIKSAFDVLIPKEVNKQSDYLRQGEWFMVAVKEKDVPDIGTCLASGDEITLPVESEDSNFHEISSEQNLIGPDGRIFSKDPLVCHTEHASMSGKGWYTFYRNTALRSFSEQGVD